MDWVPNWRDSMVSYDNMAPPLYSSDIRLAFQVEERIAELELQGEYELALAEVVTDGKPNMAHVWDYVHASPEQRCRAALEAVKGKTKVASG